MADFEHALVGKAHVMRLKGDFYLPEHAAALKDAFAGYFALEAPCVVVNWAGIRWLNAIGLGALLDGVWQIQKHGGHVRNCSLSKRHLDLLTLLKTRVSHWEVFDTEQEAIDSCAATGHISGS